MKEEQEKRVYHPHDKLVKAGFGDVETARSFFESRLPEELRGVLELGSLQLEGVDFIGKDLEGGSCDLLYRVGLKGGGEESAEGGVYVHLLFEHVRRRERYLGVKMARYQVKVWERVVERGEGVGGEWLPPIVSVVLVQGGGVGEWGGEFERVYGVGGRVGRREWEALREYGMRFRMVVVDLGGMEEGELVREGGGNAACRLVLWALKAGASGGWERLLVEGERLYVGVKREMRERVWRYLLEVVGVDRREIERIENSKESKMRRDSAGDYECS
ncbi:MAG: Rpn family recombination-promoting nuclease/putative transposase [Chthoniobacterales bacterium]|nr:Rpn family recombination-promoting nuclease/putative transposase [Chthoniobacterales bacterium]